MYGLLTLWRVFLSLYGFTRIFILFCWFAGYIWLTVRSASIFHNYSSKHAKSAGNISFSKFEIGVVVGLMLGDGSQQNNRYEKNHASKRNRRLAMCIRSDVLYYQKWQHSDQLKNYFTRMPPYPNQKNNPTQYSINSCSLPVFTEIYKYWYTNKKGVCIKKVPPLAYQNKHFNEVSQAHWIINDGYWDGTVIICTESFSKKEVVRLIKQLNNKFGLKRATKKRYDRTEFQGGVCLRFSGKVQNLEKLVSLVKPYMHPNLVYKFGPYKTVFSK